MKRYIGGLAAAMFVFSLPAAGELTPVQSETRVWPLITNEKAEHYGKHTAPPDGKPDKRKWQGTKTKK